MGFTQRIGQKVKSGLRLGAKLGALGLTIAGGLYGFKKNEERKEAQRVENKLQEEFKFQQALSNLTPDQAMVVLQNKKDKEARDKLAQQKPSGIGAKIDQGISVVEKAKPYLEAYESGGKKGVLKYAMGFG